MNESLEETAGNSKIDHLSEQITDLLVDHFLEMDGGLLIKPRYLIEADMIHLAIGEQMLVCDSDVDKERLLEALKKSYLTILVIGGIPETVESIEDLGDCFKINIVTVH